MKFPIPMLAIFIALVPIVSVRANEKTEFLHSLVIPLIPLSGAEVKQVDSLIKAKNTAEAAQSVAVNSAIEAQEAAGLAIPLTKAALQKKADMLEATSDATAQKADAARDALLAFEEAKSLLLPSEVVIAMHRQRGAISFQTGNFAVGLQGFPVLLHISVALKAQSDIAENGTPTKEYISTKRSQLFQHGLDIDPAPWYVDIFEVSTTRSGLLPNIPFCPLAPMSSCWHVSKQSLKRLGG